MRITLVFSLLLGSISLFAGEVAPESRPKDGALHFKSKGRSVIQVNSTVDAVDFGGSQQVGDLPGPDGLISLREAILAANNTAGEHIIEFNIPSAGNDFHDSAWWLTPTTGNHGPLPEVTASVIIDGYTQTSNRGDTNPDGPELVVDGSGLSSGAGLVFSGADSALVDLVIQNVPDAGVRSLGATGLTIMGCYIGTSHNGLIGAANGVGVELLAGTSGAVIGGAGAHGAAPAIADRNVIAGNTGNGVTVTGVDTVNNSIIGNRVGTDRTGTAALANGVGIAVGAGASTTTVGGANPGEGNLVSGNSGAGIEVSGTASATIIQGNWVGVDAGGTAALSNAVGVHVLAGTGGTLVGGSALSGEGNLISGNSTVGVWIDGADDVTVAGNLIGTDESAAVAVVNLTNGVLVSGGATSNTVGGLNNGEGNVCSGNGGSGVAISGAGTNDNFVVGNLLGTDGSGGAVLGNASSGVAVTDGASSNHVGGSAVGAGNRICGNPVGVVVNGPGTDDNILQGNTFGIAEGTGIALANGVNVEISGAASGTIIGGLDSAANEIANATSDGIVVTGAGIDNTITGNSIHDNSGLGIDLGGDGITANDPGDTDDGPNHLVNYPVIASTLISRLGSTTVVTGSVDTPCVVEFFGSLLADPSGYGEGKTYLGATTLSVAGAFSASLPEQPVGSVIAATCSDATGSTSEFSAAVEVSVGPLEVCHSGCPFTSIQTAIDAAINGDTVLVHDGVYLESIIFPSSWFSRITVRSVNGAAATSIDGNGASAAVLFSGGTALTVLEGFTITNANFGVELSDADIVDGTFGEVRDCVITGNANAGLSVGQRGFVSIKRCEISGNGGAGVEIDSDSHVTLSNCLIRENSGPGITICCYGRIHISDSVIDANGAAGMTGTGFQVDFEVIDCEITNNIGAGIDMGAGNSDDSFVSATLIAGNHSHGITVNLVGSNQMTLVNSIIAGNFGKGVLGVEKVVNCTVAGNSDVGLHSHVSLVDSIISNSIFWGNNSDGGGVQISGSAVASYSDVEGGWPGDGNIDEDPLFVDPQPAWGAPTSAGDYHLTALSPCIDAGTDQGAPPDDFDGDQRPLGAGWDMGADEFDPGQIFANSFEQGNMDLWSTNSMEVQVNLPGDVSLVMVRLLQGQFEMGAFDGEDGAFSNEYPSHVVTFSEGFYIGKHEVTQAQWEALMGANPAEDWGVGDDYPVYNVSWSDVAGADGFIERLNQHLIDTGQSGAGLYRLPTEAEWEWAARGKTATRFSFGDNLTCGEACEPCSTATSFMWWCGNAAVSTAQPVGEKLPNSWGLHDMHGNIDEWVGDWYGLYTADSQTDPTGPETGTERVKRGGAWFFDAAWCRSAARGGGDPETGLRRTGFRLASSL